METMEILRSKDFLHKDIEIKLPSLDMTSDQNDPEYVPSAEIPALLTKHQTIVALQASCERTERRLDIRHGSERRICEQIPFLCPFIQKKKVTVEDINGRKGHDKNPRRNHTHASMAKTLDTQLAHHMLTTTEANFTG
ncbi:unnamed protein product [Haemonchus placei]|uniref:Uncharacterized protein n=1 Tax=Haemonchus placei TaxID=6290 RepID=A0A0N4VRW5_HAEPC|nr:unnamed protein product [Haemonchus placei]